MRHSGALHSGEFSQDGHWVTTASADGGARVWDGFTGRPVTEWFRHRSHVAHVSFSPDQQWMATASVDKTARIWELPEAPVPVPSWLPELAEAVVHLRRNAAGHEAFVSPAEFLEMRERLADADGQDAYTLWARWFLADRSTRVMSPHSPVTVTEYVRQRLAEGSESSIREALRLAPTNGVAWARLARVTLSQTTNATSRLQPITEHASRLAFQFAPAEAETWWAQSDLREREGHLVEAEQAMRRALVLQPDNPALTAARIRLLERLQQVEEALRAASEAVARAETGGARSPIDLTKALLQRRELLLRSGHPVEAQADFLRAKSIPARDPACSTNCLDLSPFYNAALHEDWHGRQWKGNNLATLPTGQRTFGGVEFDVRGVVQLAGVEIDKHAPGFPKEASRIPVRRIARRIHFLHASAWGNYVRAQARIGSYVIHYADGTIAEVPLRTGEELAEWQASGGPKDLPHAHIAWLGTNPLKARVQLFKHTWENSRPDVPVETLDFRSDMTAAAPFLIAITADDSPPPVPEVMESESPRLKNIPKRDPLCSTNCLDLSPHYNAALGDDWHNPPGSTGWNLRSLPAGRQIFGSVEFDVRGVIQLFCRALERDYPEFPRVVSGIAVGQPCRALHFLHASIWSERLRNGTVIGKYVVHYADGQTAEIPNVHGEDSRAWQIANDGVTRLARATVPWSGTAPNGAPVRVFKRTWVNPRPEVTVETLDLHSGESLAGVFVIAITAEP
jgi:tetratricopeptide (TPR) repeat protein